MKKPIITLILLLLAVVLSAGCIQNPDYPPSPQLPQTPPPVDEDSLYYFDLEQLDPDAPPTYYKIIPSVEEFLSDLNVNYNLGLTEEEISSYAEELDTVYLKDAKRSETEVRIDDIVAFQAEVSRMMNINQELHETIVEDLIAPPDNFFEGPEAPRVPLKPGAVVVERDVANMNRVYSLGLTEEEILKIADGIKTGYLKDAERTDGLMEHLDYFFVEDKIAYLAEIAKILNLSQETFEEYIWMLEHPIVY